MPGVPVAVIIKGAGFLEHAGEFTQRGAVVDVRLRAGVAVFEGAFLFRLAPEDFVIAIRVEGLFDLLTPWIDVDQIDQSALRWLLPPSREE